MGALAEHLLHVVPGFVLHVIRAAAFVWFLPGLGQGSDARWLRLVLGLALGAIFWWIGDRGSPAVHGTGHLLLLGAGEFLVGAAVGFVVQLVGAVLTVAGEILAQEMGFTMSQVMDPLTGTSTQVVSQLLQVVGILAMFALDLHHDFLRALAAAFQAVPVGTGFDLAVLHERHAALVAAALEAGVRYAMPVLAVMLVLTAMLAVLSRAVPNINLMEFSFGLRILLALLMALLLFTEGMPGLAASLQAITGGAAALFVH
ncbi:MAG TPA: flagellar biosynthetic protein FliR [Planctomycetota bacterium]|nr:flagellar biosynthetic protein FliR [Planctomycetota bacterium]